MKFAKLYKSKESGKVRWEVRWSDPFTGKTKRKKFSRKDDAEQHQFTVDAAFRNDDVWISSIDPQTKHAFRFMAEESARNGLNVIDVWQHGLNALRDATNRPNQPGLLASELVSKFIEAKKAEALSRKHLHDLGVRLGQFAKDFQTPINFIRSEALRLWFGGLRTSAKLPVSPRSHNNYRGAVATFFGWCKRHKHLPSDWSELDTVPKIKIKTSRVAIFTPDELSLLLTAADERIRPYIAFGGLAGIRTEELMRLGWSNVNWDKGYIFLSRDITKTNVTRMVPIQDNLREWLQPYLNASGKILSHARPDQAANAVARRIGVKWKRNGLRHSYISYRVAETQNLDQVAMEAGNSRGEIHAHYLELATIQDAAKWFSILPATVPQNLLALKFA